MTRSEVETLRQVTNVIRLGHVIRIDGDALVLEGGTVSTDTDWLHVDCSAAGIRDRRPVPDFDGDRITLQYVMQRGQLTAALTAFVELKYEDDVSKNSVCRPIPITGNLVDLPRNLLADLTLRGRWLRHPPLRQWMVRSRLDPTAGAASRVAPTDSAKQAAMKRARDSTGPARSRLEELLASLDSRSSPTPP